MPRLDADPLDTPAVFLSTRPMSENLTGAWRSLRPVVDLPRCTGCNICWKFCPEACIRMEADRPVVDLGYCKGCGICAVECPPRCIEMVGEERA